MDFDDFLNSKITTSIPKTKVDGGISDLKKDTPKPVDKSIDKNAVKKEIAIKPLKKLASFGLPDEFLSTVNSIEDNQEENNKKAIKFELEKKRKADEIKKMEEAAKPVPPLSPPPPPSVKLEVDDIVLPSLPSVEELPQKVKDEYTIDKNFIDVSAIKDVIIEGTTKKLEEINIEENINLEEIERQNEEYLTIYYILNDNTDNPEFLDEDVLAISKKEAELREAQKQKEDEFNFKLEELVDNNRVSVDLRGLVN